MGAGLPCTAVPFEPAGGFDGLVRFNPGASEFGPSADLSLSWGGNSSGMRQLWEPDAAAPNLYHEAAGRYEARWRTGSRRWVGTAY